MSYFKAIGDTSTTAKPAIAISGTVLAMVATIGALVFFSEKTRKR